MWFEQVKFMILHFMGRKSFCHVASHCLREWRSVWRSLLSSVGNHVASGWRASAASGRVLIWILFVRVRMYSWCLWRYHVVGTLCGGWCSLGCLHQWVWEGMKWSIWCQEVWSHLQSKCVYLMWCVWEMCEGSVCILCWKIGVCRICEKKWFTVRNV